MAKGLAQRNVNSGGNPIANRNPENG